MPNRGETQHQTTLRKAKEQCENKYTSVFIDSLSINTTDIVFIFKLLKSCKGEDNICLQKSPERN